MSSSIAIRVAGVSFVLASLGLNACWVKQETGEKMLADIIMMQTELEVIKKAHHAEKAKLEQRLQEADKRIAELNLLTEEYRRVTGRNAADVGVEIEQIKTQLMEMRGQTEVNQHRLEIIEKRLSIIHNDLAAQKQSVIDREEKRQKDEEEARKEKEEKENKNPLKAIERPKKKEDFYRLAYGLLESGQTKASRMLFNEFLMKWPKDAYADNALYWIAETHYKDQNFREAALTFQRVRKEFSRGDKAPDALLKLGYCFYSMGMYREALPFLREFVQTYRKNPLTKKAKLKIKEAERQLKQRR